MPRAQYKNVVFNDAGSFLSGGNVDVRTVDAAGVQGGSGSALIYASEAGAAKGNPFLTPAQGRIEFWADIHARYDIVVTGSGYSTETFRWDNQWWQPRPRTVGMLELALTNEPIGKFMWWWRPSAAVAMPTGYTVCLGQTLTASQHDFPIGGSIVLPNFANLFIVGADPIASVDGTPGTTTTAPGIGGIAGAHAAAIAHQHTIAQHYHNLFDHIHFFGPHKHGIFSKTRDVVQQGPQPVSLATETYEAGALPTSTQYGSSSRFTDWNVGGGITDIGGATQDVRPRHIGMLPLLKVKNT